jgi:hypothetical protein
MVDLDVVLRVAGERAMARWKLCESYRKPGEEPPAQKDYFFDIYREAYMQGGRRIPETFFTRTLRLKRWWNRSIRHLVDTCG